MSDTNKDDIGFMDFIFYVLIEIALGGLCIAIAQHSLSYGNLQWISATGMIFVSLFVFKKIMFIMFTKAEEAWNYMFSKSDKSKIIAQQKEHIAELADEIMQLNKEVKELDKELQKFKSKEEKPKQDTKIEETKEDDMLPNTDFVF